MRFARQTSSLRQIARILEEIERDNYPLMSDTERARLRDVIAACAVLDSPEASPAQLRVAGRGCLFFAVSGQVAALLERLERELEHELRETDAHGAA